jgi:hypothetical protein
MQMAHSGALLSTLGEHSDMQYKGNCQQIPQTPLLHSERNMPAIKKENYCCKSSAPGFR